MKYKVHTREGTQVYEVESLLSRHRHDKKLCKLLKAGISEIRYTITGCTNNKDLLIVFNKVKN